MSRRLTLLFLLVTTAVMLPLRSPAPLIYTPGEGWYYELFGNNTKWQRPRAKDQVEVAEQALADKDYSTAMHAANRVLRVFPLSDYAPRAEYVLGRCFEAKGKDEAAFDAYQNIIQKYPKSTQYNEVMTRQYEIANRFLAGEWFRLWNTIPLYPSMDETAKLYAKIVSNGPYSAVAPHAQLKHRHRPGKSEKLWGCRESLPDRRRPLSRPAGNCRRRHVSHRRRLAKTSRHRRI